MKRWQGKVEQERCRVRGKAIFAGKSSSLQHPIEPARRPLLRPASLGKGLGEEGAMSRP